MQDASRREEQHRLLLLRYLRAGPLSLWFFINQNALEINITDLREGRLRLLLPVMKAACQTSKV